MNNLRYSWPIISGIAWSFKKNGPHITQKDYLFRGIWKWNTAVYIWTCKFYNHFTFNHEHI